MAEKKKKTSRRSKCKYPALERSLNLKSRRYYIEPDYINGVISEDGEQVIRPLNEEEKAWLNKFYEETVVTKFNKDDSDFYSSAEERRALWRENNHRNTCIFNVAQKTGKLNSFNARKYEKEVSEACGHLDYEQIIINELEEEVEEYDGTIYTIRHWEED